METFKKMIHIIKRVESDNVSLYLLFKNNNTKQNHLPKWAIYKMKTTTDLSKDILNINTNFLKKTINIKSLDIVEYSPGPNTDNIVEKSNVDNLPKFNEIKDLLTRTATPLPTNSKVKYYKPIAYIFKLDTFINDIHEKSIVTFQYLVQQNTLKKGHIIGRADDTFRRMENDLYYIGPNLDALYCENIINNEEIYMYIFNKQHIDWIFGFGDVFKEEIKTIFNENEEKYGKIINVNDLTNFVLADYQFVRKTYKVLKNGSFEKYFNKETILKVEKEAKISKLKWESEKLVVNEENVKKILNICNEDYLKSVVSDNVFRSLSKTSIG